jgi:hypothetical protein
MLGKDPVVERMRKVKRKMAEEFHYDIHEFADHIRDRQSRSGGKLVNTLKIVRDKRTTTYT